MALPLLATIALLALAPQIVQLPQLRINLGHRAGPLRCWRALDQPRPAGNHSTPEEGTAITGSCLHARDWTQLLKLHPLEKQLLKLA